MKGSPSQDLVMTSLSEDCNSLVTCVLPDPERTMKSTAVRQEIDSKIVRLLWEALQGLRERSRLFLAE